jgi:peroxiredoxin
MSAQGSVPPTSPCREPAAGLCYGIPDVVLERFGGGTINPSWFAGHELVVFFCPADPAAAAAEIASYAQRSEEFAKCGAWLIGVRSDEGCQDETVHDPITIALDHSGAGWAAFESLLDPAARTAEAAGGTFLFYRGGRLGRTWQGAGHAAEALEALRARD